MTTHDSLSAEPRTLPLGVVLALAAFAGGATLYHLVGDALFLSVTVTAVSEAMVLGLFVLAAGGWGHLCMRWLYPRGLSSGFRAVVSVAAGLGVISVLTLILGSTVGLADSLHGWGLLLAGAGLAGWQVRRRIMGVQISTRVSWSALLWVVFAIVVAYWWAGALRPPGLIGMAQNDFYDVLEYHLQVPREFLQAGRVEFLPHNVYSQYPLGVEMLFTLGNVGCSGRTYGKPASFATFQSDQFATVLKPIRRSSPSAISAQDAYQSSGPKARMRLGMFLCSRQLPV